MPVLISALIVLSVTLAVVALWLGQGYRRNPEQPMASVNTGDAVTVLVAARNEEKRLPALLSALAAQAYPHECLHVMVIDDRSSDDTQKVLTSVDMQGIDITVLCQTDVPAGISPKKFALATGIENAQTELLLFTDADCIPESQWVDSMVQALQHTDVVVGVAPLLNDAGTTAAAYAAYESHRTMTFMLGTAGWGCPYMATGRNWGYRKSAYLASGGLEPLFHVLGGDDDLLFQQFLRSGARTAAVQVPGSVVYSHVPPTWRALLRQKRRHYGVSKHYVPKAALGLGMLQLLEWSCIICAVIAILALEPVWKFVSAGILVIPALSWMRTLSLTGLLTGGEIVLAPVRECIHLFFSTIAGISGLLSSREW